MICDIICASKNGTLKHFQTEMRHAPAKSSMTILPAGWPENKRERGERAENGDVQTCQPKTCSSLRPKRKPNEAGWTMANTLVLCCNVPPMVISKKTLGLAAWKNKQQNKQKLEGCQLEEHKKRESTESASKKKKKRKEESVVRQQE